MMNASPSDRLARRYGTCTRGRALALTFCARGALTENLQTIWGGGLLPKIQVFLRGE